MDQAIYIDDNDDDDDVILREVYVQATTESIIEQANNNNKPCAGCTHKKQYRDRTYIKIYIMMEHETIRTVKLCYYRILLALLIVVYYSSRWMASPRFF